jgi:hypothetical protein
MTESERERIATALRGAADAVVEQAAYRVEGSLRIEYPSPVPDVPAVVELDFETVDVGSFDDPDQTLVTAEESPEGYCVRCRRRTPIRSPVQVAMKNGRPAIKGTCPDCGTAIFKVGRLVAPSENPRGV